MRSFFLSLLLCTACISTRAQAPRPDSLEFEKVFTGVPMTAEFKGGESAWIKFLTRNLRLPQETVEKDFSGRISVQFVVGTTGKVSDIKLLYPSDSALAHEITRVIKLSDGMWTPAVACGRMVKSYKKMDIPCIKSEEQ